MAIFLKYDIYLAYGIIALVGAATASLINPDKSKYKTTMFISFMLYVATSILPTLLTVVLSDIIHELPQSIYLLISYLLGLVGNDLTKQFTSLKFSAKFIRNLLKFLGKGIDKLEESLEKEIKDDSDNSE